MEDCELWCKRRAQGLQPQAIADMLGLSLATVKTNLNRIFKRSATTRQAELLTLTLRASTPVV